MFWSMAIIRGLVLHLAKVTLKHTVKLRCYILCGDVTACHRSGRVLCAVQNETQSVSFCTAHNTHADL